MRAPNGYGTVSKIDKKTRRKPWVFRVTVGYRPNKNGGLSPVVKTIGTYATKKEAFQARDEYNKREKPGYVPTFAEAADDFEKEHFPTIAKSTKDNYVAARAKCSAIAFKPISEITYTDLQEVVNAAKESTQAILKAYLNLVYKDAIRKEYVEKNTAELLKVAKKEKSTIHFRFTPEEISKIKALPDSQGKAFVLLSIYTGARPSELLKAERKGDDLKLRTGKTKAAARVIPIHKDAIPLLDFFPFSYENYNDLSADFRVILSAAGVLNYVNPETGAEQKHKPHDGRHTFATLWHEQRLNEGIRRYIQGHVQEGIGAQVYTHFDLNEIRKELNTLKV